MRSTAIWYALGGGAVLAVGAGVAVEQNLDRLPPNIRDWLGPPPASVAMMTPPAPKTGAPAPLKPSPALLPSAAPAPGFDIVRVETSGDTVVAGHAAPFAKVELRDGDRVLGSASADDSGRIATRSSTMPRMATITNTAGIAAMTGTPAVLARSRAETLLPSSRRVCGVGPMKISPAARHASAKPGFSDRKP